MSINSDSPYFEDFIRSVFRTALVKFSKSGDKTALRDLYKIVKFCRTRLPRNWAMELDKVLVPLQLSSFGTDSSYMLLYIVTAILWDLHRMSSKYFMYLCNHAVTAAPTYRQFALRVLTRLTTSTTLSEMHLKCLFFVVKRNTDNENQTEEVLAQVRNLLEALEKNENAKQLFYFE